MKKPDFNAFRQNINMKKLKMSKRKPLDMETLRQRTENMFIPAYGSEKLQLPRFVINHSLPIKLFWDIFILVFILYTATVVPFTVSFEYSDDYITYFDTFVDCMFIIDIILTFFTTYIDEKGNLVTNLKKIRLDYLKGWFLLDVAASFPYSILVLQIGSESKVVSLIRILKIIRLVRIGKVSQKMGRLMQTSTVTLGMWLLVFCLCAHWMACIWYSIALKIDNPAVVFHSWLAVLADISNSPYKYEMDDENQTRVIKGTGPTNASLYISALYYTMSSLTTCGFGNIAPNTSAEKVFGCITMLLGCVLYAFIFGQITNIISQFQRNANTFTDRLNSIKRFNSIYKVPMTVGKRLEDYFTSTWAITKGTDEEEILGQCPRDLQSDLCLHIHGKIFESNPAFGRLNTTSLRCLARYLWTIRTSPGDMLIYQGENVENIYFVATGSVEVKDGDDLVGLIGPGDAFGIKINQGVVSEKSVYDVRACSYGSIHCISNDDIQDALKIYPSEFIKVKYDLVLAFNITEEIKKETKSGEAVEETKAPSTSKQVEHIEKPTTNIYFHGDEVAEMEPKTHVDLLAGMSELKGELRRETERMNSKMGVVEAQMRLVLKLLRRQNKIDVDPEIGSQLNELSKSFEDDIDDTAVEWFVADSSGWKKGPPSTQQRQRVRKSSSMISNINDTVLDEETLDTDGGKFYTTIESFDLDA